MKKLKNSLVIVAAFVAGSLVSIATTAVLAHGGDASKIHGCVRNNGLLAGFIRVVGANDNCNNNETALDWNIQGLPGPSGPPGGTASGSANFGLPFTCFGPCRLSSVADKFKGKDFSNMIGQIVFDDVDISDVIFKNAHFYGSRFNNTNLANADFSSVDFKNGDTISGASWGYPQGFINVTATNSNFSNAILNSINLKDSNFQNANFSESEITLSLQNSQFQNANFTNANFTNFSISEGVFANANFQNVNFTEGGFSSVNLQGAQNMNTATFNGTIEWSNTTCPDGTNSDNNGNTCIGHLTP